MNQQGFDAIKERLIERQQLDIVSPTPWAGLATLINALHAADTDVAALIAEVRRLRVEHDAVKAKLNDTIDQWDRVNAIRRRQEETIDRMRMFVQQALDRANRFLEADSPIPFEALDDIADDLRIALKEPDNA